MLEKLRNGMHVVTRESSISHFLEKNLRIVTEMGIEATSRISFCTDDVVASDILKRGHLDNMVRMAIAMGIKPMAAIQMATINGAEALRIGQKVGSISPGLAADILLVRDLKDFRAAAVIAKGRLAARDGNLIGELTPPARSALVRETFKLSPVSRHDLEVQAAEPGQNATRALSIAVTPDQIFVRKRRDVVLPVKNGLVEADPSR